MKSIKTLLQKTPNALLCALGAAAFILLFYMVAYRTPLGEIWLVPSMDNDEVIYNRQVVSVIAHGGPQGYFGYEETHAAIGRFGTWGPLLIWAYALPGFLFGAGVNTVLWCNVFFAVAGLAFFARAARLRVWQGAVLAAAYVCLWTPIDFIFSGSSEALHYSLALVIVGASAALARHDRGVWFWSAFLACGLETIFRPYALLFWAFPLAAVWVCKRRRALCLGGAAVSFVAALCSMTWLSAPYFSGGGMDFTGFRLLAGGDLPGAMSYELDRAAELLRVLWVGDLVPLFQGNPQYVGVGCAIFVVLVLVTAGCLVWDLRHGRPCRNKVIALVCTGIIALVLLFMYNIAPRHLMLLCMLLLGALVVENTPQWPVWLPVLAVLLLPMNLKRSSMPTYNAGLAEQMTVTQQALTESLAARDSDDPWDNTLAYAYADDVFHGYLYGVPAGMGIEFDNNTYLADPANPIYSRYAMVNHGTAAEARLVADGWQQLVSTEDLVVYERPDGVL